MLFVSRGLSLRISLLLIIGMCVAGALLSLRLPVEATSQVGPLLVSVTTTPNPYALEGATSVASSVGVLGSATQPSSNAVEGLAQASGAMSNGVFGYSANGFGVYGTASAPYGGVFGLTSTGVGVWGKTTAAYDGNVSTDETGVLGIAQTQNGAGVYGWAQSSGIALYGLAQAGSTALSVLSDGGLLMQATNLSSNKDVMSLDASGNMILAGTVTQQGSPLSVVADSSGVRHVAYGAQQTIPTIEDFGSGHMIAGRAYVKLAPDFSSVVANDSSYMVFVTAGGPNEGLYVTGKTSTGFDVVETSGRATMGFDYRVVARPRMTGSSARLALASGPKTPSGTLPNRRSYRTLEPRLSVEKAFLPIGLRPNTQK